MADPVVLRFSPDRAGDLRAMLERAGFKFEARPNAFFLARRPGVTLTAYDSGKILVTGPQADEYARIVRHELALPPDAAPAPPPARDAPPAGFARRIGSDETGKGDYFGPLVVAAVLMPDAATEAELTRRGVRDSKSVPDAEAALLGSLVAARCPHHVIALPPARYNEMHARTGNLNVMLAWAHAHAIEDVLQAAGDVPRIVVDRFAHGSRLADALGERARRAELVEVPGAESKELAVAAASLLARAEFLRALRGMEERWGVPFPKSGGGRGVESAGRRFVQRHGRENLGEVAKLHFATTGRVVR